MGAEALSRPPRVALFGGLAVALAVAAWARLTSIPKVFVAGEVFPQGGDSAYHLRRTLLTADAGAVPVHDPLMNWPHGGPCHWAPGLDALAALLTRVLPGEPAAIAMFVPVGLGLLVVLAAWAVARRLVPGGPLAAGLPAAAALVVALLPQAEATGRVGRLDHHVAEVLCMTLLGAWALGERRELRWELAGAGILGFGLAFFAGSILYAGVATALLLVLAAQDPPRGWVGSGAPAFAGAAVGVAVVYGAPVGGAFSFVFPSLLQPVLLLLGAAALALAGPLRRGSRGLGVALLVAAACVPLLPGVREGLTGALVGWLGRQDDWIASIHEFQPILSAGPFAAESWAEVRRLFALPGLLAPLTVPLGLFEAVRRDRRKGVVFAGWTLLILALTLWQLRFGRLFTVNLALCTALAVAAVCRRAPRPAAAMLVAVLGLVVASPELRKPLAPVPERALAPIEEAALALRIDRDPVPGDGDGVFVPWDLGHFILQIARRPVVATGFGTYLDPDGYRETVAAPRGTEAELVAWMERRDLGWAVAGGATQLAVRDSAGRQPLVRGEDGLGRLDRAYLAELPLGTLLVGGSGVPGEIPHLERLRPVGASTATIGGAAAPLPVLWTYRLVEPTVLRGVGPPGARVAARIDLTTPGGALPWMAWTTAGPDGAWALRVPIEPAADYGSVVTGSEFVVQVGDAAPVAYSEPDESPPKGPESP